MKSNLEFTTMLLSLCTNRDCYVAATGVPQARDDHAVAMVRFANAILLRANALSKALESTLGPGTGDLTMRVGKCVTFKDGGANNLF
jgi:hypothetical protein